LKLNHELMLAKTTTTTTTTEIAVEVAVARCGREWHARAIEQAQGDDG